MGQPDRALPGARPIALEARTARWAFGLAGLQFLFAGFLLAATAPIGPPLAAEWGLDPARLGLLGSAMFYAYAAMQIPAGVLADALGSRRVLVLSALLASMGAFAFGAAPDFPTAVVGRLVLGAGTGLVYTAGVRLISTLASRRQGGRDPFVSLYGPYVGLNYLGTALASIPLLALIGAVGWRPPILATGAILATLAVWTWAMPPMPEGVEPEWRGRLSAGIRAWRGDRTVLAYSLLRFLLGSFAGMQTLWAVPLLLVTFGVGRDVVGLALLAMAVGQIAGPPLGARLAARLKRVRPVVIAGALAYAVGCAALYGLAHARPGPLAVTVAFFFLSITQSVTLIGYGLVTARVSPDLQGTVAGLVNLGPFLGSALFQAVAGVVVQAQLSRTGAGPAAYSALIGLLAAIALAALPLTRLLRE